MTLQLLQKHVLQDDSTGGKDVGFRMFQQWTSESKRIQRERQKSKPQLCQR